ncbi:MAG: AzlD domain-containing protein [Clostridia bacterium]|nr:AzlD domain-containing protein [Clostridia bacterium]
MNLIGYILVMAGVTYGVRCLPLVLLRKDITNVYVRSFFKYIPYAVLGSMTFPAILYATGSMISALAGLLTAAVLAYLEKSLLTVASIACVVVFLVEML